MNLFSVKPCRAGGYKITQVIVTSCYIANINCKFLAFKQQVNSLKELLGIVSEEGAPGYTGVLQGSGRFINNIDNQTLAD